MSNLVFPKLPGLEFGTVRTPIWRNAVRESDSGRTFSKQIWSSPRWAYKLSYEFLRAGAEAELQQLVGFFNMHKGDGDSWLFDNEDDNTATLEPFGTGNAATASFQLVRALGGVVEAIYELNGSPLVYLNTGTWQGDAPMYSVARTNLFTYSDQFDNAAWAKTALTVTADAGADPAGGTAADLLTVTTSNAGARVTQTKAVTVAGQHTVSYYLKAGTTSTARLLIYNQSTSTTIASALADMAAGTVMLTSGDAASCEVLAGGWVRVQLTCPAVTAGQTLVGYIYPRNSGNNAGDTIYAWRAQLEAGGAATRPIATVAAAVTAPADYTLGAKGLVTFTAPPAVGAIPKWSGKFYWRARFKDSQMDFEKFMDKLWRVRQVEFITEKP